MPERFGAYEIERRLGAGGMAEVFLAQRRGPEGFAKRVALKRVLPGYNQDPEFVRLFQDEARLAARLDHPHIAGIHDFGEIDGTWYMAMEYVDGSDLRTLLGGLAKIGQPMPTDLVVLVAADLASALLYAHEVEIDGSPARIVHRDVTPSNILVSVDGAIRLADFGIAKAASHGHHTRTGIVKGKVPYMPPEQALGESMDHRVDLFALGVVLFECIAGKRPYVGVTELDTLQKISKGQHAPLGELAPHAPLALVEVVERLIRPSAAERYASAADVLDALAATPPPTNARRLLGNLVRRVQREAPRSVSEVRGFGRTEPIDEPASRTRTSGELARRALVAIIPPREDVARALAKAAQEATHPALAQRSPPPSPAGDQATRSMPVMRPAPAADVTRAFPSTPLGARAPDSIAPISENTGRPPARSPRSTVPRGVIVATVGALLAALVVVVVGVAAWTLRARSSGLVAASSAPAPALEPQVPAIPEVAASPPPEPARPTSNADAGAEVALTTLDVPELEVTGETDDGSEGSAAQRRRARPRSSSTATREPEAREPLVAQPSEAPPAEVAPGRVHVVALPVGDVTIDGRAFGSAPVSASLRPGRHVVVVRNGEREERRTVELASEHTERVVVRFPLDR